MIVGIGVDTVDIERFTAQLARTPALADRLFVPAERDLPAASLAARFAAKEAIIKALGGSGDLGWHDLEVVGGRGGPPDFARTPALRRAMRARAGAGASVRAHLSLAHDGGLATAFVILERVTNGETQ